MMAQLRIDFQRCGKVETFPWARVQPIGNGVQRPLGVGRQIRALRQVLAQQPVGILVGSALPGTMRIGKKDLDRKPLGQLLVLGHLFAPIVRQGFAQCGGYVPEFLREALAGTRRIRPLHPSQENQARRPLDQRADGRLIASPLEEVAFPVPRHSTSGHVGGALGNGRHVGDVAPSVDPARPRATCLARLPQRRQEFTPQGATGQDIQGGIDRFGREPFPHIVRIRVSQPPGNLFRRATRFQVGLNVRPEPGIQEFAGTSRLTSSGGCLGLSGAGPIRSVPCDVAGHLAAHGAGSSPQEVSKGTERVTLGQPKTQGLTFFGTQMLVRFRMHGNTVAHPGLKCCTWS